MGLGGDLTVRKGRSQGLEAGDGDSSFQIPLLSSIFFYLFKKI